MAAQVLFLVKTWTVEKPTACAERTARSCPPAIDMWDPNFARIGPDPSSQPPPKPPVRALARPVDVVL